MSGPQSTLSEQGARTTAGLGGKYLTFGLGSEVYGIEILKVQEIIGIMKVNHVPKMPDYVRGVINLRGTVIPVLDLRQKFGMETREDTERTCIIVIQVHLEHAAVTIGIVVDEVSEVVAIEESQMELPPSFGAAVDTQFLLGMGKVGDKVVMLLNVDAVFGDNALLDSMGGQG